MNLKEPLGSAAVSAASSGGVSPLEGTRGGTPRELAGEDACATSHGGSRVQSANNCLGEISPLNRQNVPYNLLSHMHMQQKLVNPVHATMRDLEIVDP